jgi:hypothetical protein
VDEKPVKTIAGDAGKLKLFVHAAGFAICSDCISLAVAIREVRALLAGRNRRISYSILNLTPCSALR